MARVGRGRLMGVLLLVEDGLEVGCDDGSVGPLRQVLDDLAGAQDRRTGEGGLRQGFGRQGFGAKVSRLCAPQLRVLADQRQRNERRYVRAVSVRLCLRRVFMVCGLCQIPLGTCQTIVWHVPHM